MSADKKEYKKVPYGYAFFPGMMADNYVYIDKTQYIRDLELLDSKYPIMLRPRRFGKTMFINTLKAYYDLAVRQDFVRNFSGTWIFEHQTPLAGSFYVLNFDFSGNASGDVIENYILAVKNGIADFLIRYPIKSAQAVLSRSYKSPGALINDFFIAVASTTGKKIYVMIDEYDQSMNDLLANDRAKFQQYTSNKGFLKDFYSKLKTATNSCIDRVFITGVTSISLDSMTSGFNIALNISANKKFAAMFGFTESEVSSLISDLIDLNEVGRTSHEIIERMRAYYNGYKFNRRAQISVFNSSMALFYLLHLRDEGEEPDDLLDPAVASDLSKIDGILKFANPYELEDVVKKSLLREPIYFESLSLAINLNAKDKLSYKDLLSALIYLGYLTYSADGNYLVVPNRVIGQQFYDYYCQRILKLTSAGFYKNEFESSYRDLLIGKPHKFISIVSDKFNSTNGIHRGTHLRESDFVTLFQSSLFFSNDYEVRAEAEAFGKAKGYTDLVFLARDKIHCSYVFEFKYLTKTDASLDLVSKAVSDAKDQLERYCSQSSLNEIPNLKKVILVFRGLEIAYELVY